MIRRTTWIFLAIFFGFVLLAIVLNQEGENITETPTPTTPPALLPNVSIEEIKQMKLEDQTGHVEIITQYEDGIWDYENTELKDIDVEAVGLTVDDLLDLRRIAQPDPAPALKDVGLEKPKFIINLEMNDGKHIIYKIGDLTPTESGYYVLDDEENIVVVSKLSLDSILSLLDNPPTLSITKIPDILPTNPP